MIYRGYIGFGVSGFPEFRGTFYGGPNNKDCSLLGSILASPCLGKLPCTPCLEVQGI